MQVIEVVPRESSTATPAMCNTFRFVHSTITHLHPRSKRMHMLYKVLLIPLSIISHHVMSRNLMQCFPFSYLSLAITIIFSTVGTYDKNISAWPLCGGCNGSIRFENENQQTVNKGLGKAISLLLPFKMKYPSISWADLIQMAGSQAVTSCGGPRIPLRYGRLDIPKDYFTDEKDNLEFCVTQSKKLPCNSFPYPDGSHSPEFHLRNVFFRLGFSSREIVALCGGHTIGRGFKDRTGVCPFSSG